MDVAQRIFNQAVRGTPYNAGVTPTLAALMVAQARHETGNFTSRFFRENNNAFGYAYYAGSYYQTGAGAVADNGQPIASYPDIEASTSEVVDWIYRRYRQGKFPDPATITTPEAYATALKNAGYYGDALSNYMAGLKRFFVPMAVAGGAGIIVAAVVLGLLFHKEIFNL
jgi:hypothetical protein